MPYQHDKDLPALRQVLQAIHRHDRIGPETFQGLYDRFRRKVPETVLSVSSIKRMMADDAEAKNAGFGKPLAASELCRFVFTAYRTRALDVTAGVDLAEEAPAAVPKIDWDALSPEELLGEALERFVSMQRPVSEKAQTSLHARYPGRFVLYRADLRPLRRNTDSPPRFRASRLEIVNTGAHLLMTDVQDFPETKTDQRFYLKTVGVVFSYGSYIMSVAQAVERESFRFAVIEGEYSFTVDHKVSEFYGSILVASSEDLFPSTAFYCERDDGGTLETGYVSLKDIRSPEGRAYLADAHAKAAVHYKRAVPS